MYTPVSSLARWGILVSTAASAAANLAPRATSAPTTTASEAKVTAITGCHLHASDLYCFAGATEYLVDVKVTATTDVPSKYTDCHSHGSEMYCVDSDGEDVAVQAEGAESEEDHDHEEEGHDEHTEEEGHGHEETEEGHEHEEEETAEADENEHCHFHAGVEHCTGGSDSESESSEAGSSSSSSSSCQPRRRDYNIGLRVGLLFVILATSAIGVFGPILLHKMMPTKLNLVLIVLKQFGTGIIISTAFVHLFTHAFLMFSNECIGELGYEATTAAIVMAGMFLSFLVEYTGHRIVLAKAKASAALSSTERKSVFLSTEVLSILVMEAGIIFHSLLIGLTLVVSGDEYFITLFIVILFHQMFEGIALGSRIATIGTAADAQVVTAARPSQETSSAQDSDKAPCPAETTACEEVAPTGLTLRKKLGLAALFAFTTPIGMAIGIGVLQQFNGNDKSTVIAIGTLDALSAGILVWVGLVEMWAADWMTGNHGQKAELADADILTTVLAFTGLVAGLVVMSLLGKWA